MGGQEKNFLTKQENKEPVEVYMDEYVNEEEEYALSDVEEIWFMSLNVRLWHTAECCFIFHIEVSSIR